MKWAFNTFAFSSFPTFLPTYSVEETIRFVAAAGYDAIEFGCCAPHAWPDHLSKQRRAEIRAICESEGLAISSLLPAIGGGFGCNPASLIAAERDATTAHYRDIVDLASDFGAGMVLYIGGWRAEGVSMETGWGHSLDCLRTVASHAADRGITIAVEPTTADTNLIDTAADAVRMMRESERGNVKLMFDTCHVAYRDESLSGYVEEMGADLVHVHAADTGRAAIGDGAMDWPDLLKALTRSGYDGTFAVETGFGRRGVDPNDVALRSLAFLKRTLAECADD